MVPPTSSVLDPRLSVGGERGKEDEWLVGGEAGQASVLDDDDDDDDDAEDYSPLVGIVSGIPFGVIAVVLAQPFTDVGECSLVDLVRIIFCKFCRALAL